MALDTNVLVIGAGPIGLINAWGMKCLNPNLNITVLEDTVLDRQKLKQYFSLFADKKEMMTDKQEWDQIQGDDFTKARELLYVYAGSPKYGLDALTVPSVGDISNYFYTRLFAPAKPKEIKTFSQQVDDALQDFFVANCSVNYSPIFRTVEYMLACVKQKIEENGPVILQENDELTKILKTIKTKTGIDYASIDAKAVISNCEAREEAEDEQSKQTRLKETWIRLNNLSQKNKNGQPPEEPTTPANS